MNKTLIILLSSALLLSPSSLMFGVDSTMTEVPKVTVVMPEKALSDNDVMIAIKDVLAKKMISKDIIVKVNEGIVTLSGKVDTLKVKEDIGLLVKNVVGVKKVINNIQVEPMMIK